MFESWQGCKCPPASAPCRCYTPQAGPWVTTNPIEFLDSHMPCPASRRSSRRSKSQAIAAVSIEEQWNWLAQTGLTPSARRMAAVAHRCACKHIYGQWQRQGQYWQQ